MTRRRKARIAARTGKVMIDHPTVRHAATSIAVPVAKRQIKARGRRANRQLERYGEAASNAVTEYGLPAAEALGLYQPPKAKRTAPRIAVGFALGAVVMYFFDPAQGAARRGALPGTGEPTSSSPPPTSGTPPVATESAAPAA